tara:strand:+ start:2698 stop:4047 length:1350 start_codon:yes stop_codon:yes gene_type:complete
MARKALYKHATQVNTSSYPDDGTSPVGSNEWNEDPDPQGMLGVTPANATITIASGVATVTDTVTVVAAESGTSDTLDKLAIANTNQYDLIYLFADTGDTITLTNTSSPSADGHVATISGANETLSVTKPTILMRKGNYWYGYGGGTASDLDTTNFAASTLVVESEGISSNDNDTTIPTSAAVKAYVDSTPVGDITSVVAGSGLTGGGTSADVTLNVIGGTGITANADDIAIDSTVTTLTGSQTLTNKTLTAPTLTTPALGTPASGALTNCTALPAAQVAQGTMASGMVLVAPALGTPASGALTNCTAIPSAQLTGTIADARMPDLTGEVTTSAGAVATTITDNVVDEANLKVSNSPTNGLFLQAQSGNTGGLTWASAGGGSTLFHNFANSTTTSYAGQSGESQTLGTAVGSLASGSGDRDVYIRKIDTNNEGIFTVIHKNGALVEVQIG